MAISVTVVLKLPHASESPGRLVQFASFIPQVRGITSGQIDGEIMETVTDFIFLSSKITVDSDWIHETERLLLLERKTMTNLDSILKSGDITWPTKVYIVRAMVFPVAM